MMLQRWQNGDDDGLMKKRAIVAMSMAFLLRFSDRGVSFVVSEFHVFMPTMPGVGESVENLAGHD